MDDDARRAAFHSAVSTEHSALRWSGLSVGLGVVAAIVGMVLHLGHGHRQFLGAKAAIERSG